MNLVIILLLLLLLSFVLVIFLLYKLQKLRSNQILQIKKREIESSKAEITELVMEERKYLQETVFSAKNLSNLIKNIVPKEDKTLSLYFSNYFLLDKPLDNKMGTGGDFLFIQEVENKLFFGIIDCFGHSVGGFMFTLYCRNLANKIFYNIKGKVSLKSFLEAFEKELDNIRITREIGSNSVFFDFDICFWEKTKGYLEYCGNSRHLYHFSNDSFCEVKRNRKYLALSSDKSFFDEQKSKEFEIGKMSVNSGDMIYITSDGYIDQFGGERGGKFLPKRFRKLIEDNHHLPLEKQRAIFDETIENWRLMGKEKEKQVDDILVLGVRI